MLNAPPEDISGKKKPTAGEAAGLGRLSWAYSKLRSIEFTGAGERVMLRKRCLARPGEYLTLGKRKAL